MIHLNHCFHCGQPMAAGSLECHNTQCRIDERALPIWPWTRCGHDGIMAFYCTISAKLWLMPALGILLALIGNFSLSGRLLNIGLVCLGGWALSRYVLSLVRKANTKLFIQEESRNLAQEEYNRGLVPDTPETRKELNDEYDRAAHYEWSVRGYQWLKMTVNLATIMLVISFILSWGPGEIFPWNIKNWAYNKIENIINDPLTQNVVADTKKELDWNKHQLDYLENVLRHERGLTFEQFQYVLSNKRFNADIVIDIVKATEARGDNLYQMVYREMQLVAMRPPQKTPERDTGSKGYFQNMREMHWQILFWINGLLFLFVCGSFIFIPASFAVAHGILFGDEIKDRIKQKIEEAEEKRKGEKAGVASSAQQPSAATPKASEEAGGHSIVTIGMVSLITDLIFDKLFKRLFK